MSNGYTRGTDLEMFASTVALSFTLFKKIRDERLEIIVSETVFFITIITYNNGILSQSVIPEKIIVIRLDSFERFPIVI